MNLRRQLIVNADDFGLSQGVNRGIIEAYENGIVTSASLMVRWPAADEAATYARNEPGLSLGLHLDLGEWIFKEGSWSPLYEVVNLENIDGLDREVARQLDAFSRLCGQAPSHIDSHQHVHRTEPTRSRLIAIAAELDVPLRDCSSGIRYCGDFYGQSSNGYPYPEGISIEGLITTLKALPPGITELACHPGFGDNLDTMYRSERTLEVQVLCDPRVRAAIEANEIALRSFRNVDLNA